MRTNSGRDLQKPPQYYPRDILKNVFRTVQGSEQCRLFLSQHHFFIVTKYPAQDCRASDGRSTTHRRSTGGFTNPMITNSSFRHPTRIAASFYGLTTRPAKLVLSMMRKCGLERGRLCKDELLPGCDWIQPADGVLLCRNVQR